MCADAKTPWGGRFEGSMDEFVTGFGASLPVDREMWAADIEGSLAHVRMLGRQGIVPAEDAVVIEAGLLAVRDDLQAGAFVFDNADEDIHMAVERALTAKVGPVGGKLHTARSRNDQVATDTRIHAKRLAASLAGGVVTLQETLIARADEHFGAIMPGYTHLQKAQPVLVSHHLLAYVWMLDRDARRLRAAHDAADVSPLGSAALAGTTFPLDRRAVAEELGFAGVTPNSLDAVSDRDFLLDLSYACAVAMMHLSRLCEELVLWSSDEFGFVTMDDGYSTGSSIMPQKKNPDVAELVRGKTGRVYGDLVGLLTVMKGLPLAYNKDMQEDKEGVFDAASTLGACLRATAGMVATLRFNEDRMRAGAGGGFMAATDLADHLAAHGVPFRDAHEIVGRLVLECEQGGRTLQDLTLEELRAVSPAFGPEAPGAVDLDAVVSRRTSEGGTGHDAVRAQLVLARDAAATGRAWVEARRA
ncbi:MAG TPA: argininosuccinate lyase [Coriobacteriia bacterium]